MRETYTSEEAVEGRGTVDVVHGGYAQTDLELQWLI